MYQQGAPTEVRVKKKKKTWLVHHEDLTTVPHRARQRGLTVRITHGRNKLLLPLDHLSRPSYCWVCSVSDWPEDVGAAYMYRLDIVVRDTSTVVSVACIIVACKFSVALRPRRSYGLLYLRRPPRTSASTFSQLLSFEVMLPQCCFTSTETVLGTGSPGRPPRLSHSSWALR